MRKIIKIILVLFILFSGSFAYAQTITNKNATNIYTKNATINATASDTRSFLGSRTYEINFYYSNELNKLQMVTNGAVLLPNVFSTEKVYKSLGNIFSTEESFTEQLSNLSPFTTYYFTLCAEQPSIQYSRRCGSILSFTTQPTKKPTVIAKEATIGTSYVVLNAEIDAGGLDTVAWFEYGKGQDLSLRVDTFSSDGNFYKTWSPLQLPSKLEYETEYNFRICAENQLGKNCSNTLKFKTLEAGANSLLPSKISNTKTTCTTNNSTPVTDTTAELCGTTTILEDIPGGVGYGYFRYSTAKIPPIFCNDIYGSNMLSTRENVLSPGNKKWTNTITGLNPDTTYYYCAVVSNNTRNPSEIKYGGVASFRTLPCPTCEQKSIETKKITTTNRNSASLKGSYNFTRAVNVYFEYQEAGNKINSDSILGLLGLGGVEITAGGTLGGVSIGRTTTTGSTNENRGTNSIAQDTEIPGNSVWKTTSKQNKSAGNNGDFSTNVTGLKAGTRYLYRAVAEITSTGEKLYGFTYDFTTLGSSSSGDGSGDGVGYGNDGWTSDGGSGFGGGGFGGSSGGSSSSSGGSSVSSSGNSTGTLGGGVFGPGNNTPPPAIGQMGNPSSLSLVGNTEGIENVFIRQIMGNNGLARRYGYREGADLQAFAQNLAHTFAQAFGYVSLDGREVRVIVPNKAAYEIGLVNNVLVIYEFFDSRLTGIATTNGVLKTPTAYEYYFNKR